MADGERDGECDPAVLRCDPGVAACIRLMAAFTGRLVSDGLLGPDFVEALRELVPKASCPVEAEILATFVVAVERGSPRKPAAPKLRLIHDRNFGHEGNQEVAP
jgi:hypothetical protein